MLMFLGTNPGWSVFVTPLREKHGFSAFQMQFIYNTGGFVFCTMIIIAGRLHDRFGPRPLAAASALLVGTGWGMAWAFGESYVFLWLSAGVIVNCGGAFGYVCPIATAIKWFPNHRGLASGLTAAGFGGGPILYSFIAETMMGRGWEPMQVFGLLAVVYAPAIALSGAMMALPAGQPSHADVKDFQRRRLLKDRRFWALFAGMLTGTLPFLVIMGNAKPLASEFGLGARLAAFAIAALATGNVSGRVFWGFAMDRIGPRRAMLAGQSLTVISVASLILFGEAATPVFFVSLVAAGFCYGGNFAIYPATVGRLYGAHVLGSVYPFIMAAQAISTFGAGINGLLKDTTDSSYPGLLFALSFAVVGGLVCVALSRSISERRLGHRRREEASGGAGSGARRAEG